MKKFDDALARDWEDILTILVYNNSATECDEDDNPTIEDEVEVENFEQAGLLTRDHGIVVYMDGKEIHITIQAFSKGE